MLTSRAVVAAISFGVFCDAGQATEKRAALAPLDIRVQPNGFGNANPFDVTAVLQSAAGQLWRYCPHTQLDGIDVYYRADHPQTDFKRTASGRIGIGLSARDTHWAQYGFQFAHEFCHALANFSNNPQQLVRYPHHANLWLEESLCETASLFALHAMSRSWQSTPPLPAWKGYAPWLNDYVEKRLALRKNHLPARTPFLIWFRNNESALRRNSDRRDWNTIIAIQFLPIFEAEPRGWEAIAYLNRGFHNPKESLKQRFLTWRSESPKDLRGFVSRLATAFGLRLPPSQ
jgi:hypothetical protein